MICAVHHYRQQISPLFIRHRLASNWVYLRQALSAVGPFSSYNFANKVKI